MIHLKHAIQKLNVHQSKAVLSLEALSSTVTSNTAILHQSWKNLAHVSCTGYLWVADREKYHKKYTAVFAFTSPKSRFSKNLACALSLSYMFLFFDPVKPAPFRLTQKRISLSIYLMHSAPVDPPRVQPHLPSLVPSVFSVHNQNHMLVQWPHSSMLTDVDRNVAGNRNFRLFHKYQITQRYKTVGVNPQRSTPLREKNNRLCPHSTCVCTPDVSLVRNLWQYASGANSLAANAAKPCVNFTFSHSESRVALLSAELVNTHC